MDMDMDTPRETRIHFINNENLSDTEEEEQQEKEQEMASLITENRDYVPVTTNKMIDKLTLEIMANKSKYKKYLLKTDPDKYEKIQEYSMKLRKYETDILRIVNDYICSPNKQITTDLDEAFEHFAKSCMKYLEMKEFEKYGDYQENTNDVIFPYSSGIDKQSFSSSYWGKSIRKVHPNL